MEKAWIQIQALDFTTTTGRKGNKDSIQLQAACCFEILIM